MSKTRENAMNPDVKEVKTRNPKVTCNYCHLSEVNSLEWGPLYKLEGVVVHYFCLLFSAGLSQNGEDEEGILGFLPRDIKKELKRGEKLKCKFCRLSGATIGCSVKSCKTSYHFPCGLKKKSVFQFIGNFESYCCNHKEVIKIPLPKSERNCPICYNPVEDKELPLWPPCCKKRVFHKRCIMKMAIHHGAHFFKCPLCNDKDRFSDAMKKCGVYVPDRDATWETVPDAFVEHTRVYSRCDAQPKCYCPKGRDHSSKDEDKPWRVIRCGACGAAGIHRFCGKLKNLTWRCTTCAEVLSNKETNEPPNSSRIRRHQYDTSDDDDSSDDSNLIRLQDVIPNSSVAGPSSRIVITTPNTDDSSSDSEDTSSRRRPTHQKPIIFGKVVTEKDNGDDDQSSESEDGSSSDEDDDDTIFVSASARTATLEKKLCEVYSDTVSGELMFKWKKKRDGSSKKKLSLRQVLVKKLTINNEPSSSTSCSSLSTTTVESTVASKDNSSFNNNDNNNDNKNNKNSKVESQRYRDMKKKLTDLTENVNCSQQSSTSTTSRLKKTSRDNTDNVSNSSAVSSSSERVPLISFRPLGKDTVIKTDLPRRTVVTSVQIDEGPEIKGESSSAVVEIPRKTVSSSKKGSTTTTTTADDNDDKKFEVVDLDSDSDLEVVCEKPVAAPVTKSTAFLEMFRKAQSSNNSNKTPPAPLLLPPPVVRLGVDDHQNDDIEMIQSSQPPTTGNFSSPSPHSRSVPLSSAFLYAVAKARNLNWKTLSDPQQGGITSTMGNGQQTSAGLAGRREEIAKSERNEKNDNTDQQIIDERSSYCSNRKRYRLDSDSD